MGEKSGEFGSEHSGKCFQDVISHVSALRGRKDEDREVIVRFGKMESLSA